jgi:C4-dicarboxylate transporter, DctM subunit
MDSMSSLSSLTQGGIIAVMALVLFMTGMPIAFALGLTAIVSVLLFLGPSQFDLFGKFIFDATNDFGLLAIPLFVLMGNLFGGSRVSQQLFEAGEAWLSKIRGGLAMSSVMASSIFAALTGSSAATAAAIGHVAVPEMQARGVSARIATGAVAAGGTLGILIPPSVTLILYGIASEESIGQLFAGGIVPGIIITILFCIWIYFGTLLEQRRAANRSVTATADVGGGSPGPHAGGTAVLTREGNGAGVDVPDYTWADRITALLKVLPFVLLIIAVLGVLYTGIATPSEAAAVGVVLVLIMIGLIYRGLTMRRFLDVLLETTNQSTMILLIVAFSGVIATILSFLRVPQELATLVTEMDVNRWVVMIMVNVVLLILGCFLPPVSIIVMTTPILYPLIVGLGFDPIWFGVVMTINMEIGLITPPVGLNLYVLQGVVPDVALKDILMGALPYIFVLSASIVLFSVFPGLVTWLPGLLY